MTRDVQLKPPSRATTGQSWPSVALPRQVLVVNAGHGLTRAAVIGHHGGMSDTTAVHQLGLYEVTADMVAADGESLTEVLQRFALTAPAVISLDAAVALPQAGWRLIHESNLKSHDNVAYSAPGSDGWAVLQLHRAPENSNWEAGWTSEFIPLLPSKQARAERLIFRWAADQFAWRAGGPPALRATLTNLSSSPFPDNAEDFVGAIVFLLTSDGDELPANGFFVHSLSSHPDVVAPGETISVPLPIATLDCERLAAGEYQAVSRLVSLDLPAGPVPVLIQEG